MCHQANQLVSDGAANFWPALHIFQWGKYLKNGQILSSLIVCHNFYLNEAVKLTSTDYLSFDISADLPVVSGSFSQKAEHWSQALFVTGALLGVADHKNFTVSTCSSTG